MKTTIKELIENATIEVGSVYLTGDKFIFIKLTYKRFIELIMQPLTKIVNSDYTVKKATKQ